MLALMVAWLSRGVTDHELSSSDLDETGEVLNFVCGGQLTTSGDTESHESLVHDGCA
jgi:hypothetical protein